MNSYMAPGDSNGINGMDYYANGINRSFSSGMGAGSSGISSPIPEEDEDEEFAGGFDEGMINWIENGMEDMPAANSGMMVERMDSGIYLDGMAYTAAGTQQSKIQPLPKESDTSPFSQAAR